MLVGLTRRLGHAIGLAALVALSLPIGACGSDARPESTSGRWRGPLDGIAGGFELGGPAPDFEVHELGIDGQAATVPAQRLSDLRGEVVLLDFWGAWCSGCIKEHPMLVEMAETYGAQGVRFFGITEDSPETVSEFETLRGAFSYPILEDDGSIARQYQIVGWPTKVVVDRTGNLVWWRPGGPLPRETIAAALDAALADQRPDPGPRATFGEPRPDSVGRD